MNIIACVDENWGIGYKGELLDNIPEDKKFFRQKTMGKTVVMGRVTFLSIPNKPLDGRVNVVLSSNENCEFSKEYKNSLLMAKSIENFKKIVRKLNLRDEDIFFIGGEAVYKQAIELCDRAFITKIHSSYLADRFMPNLDTVKHWNVKQSEHLIRNNGPNLTFVEYVRT